VNAQSGGQRDDQAKKFVHVAEHSLRERAENNPVCRDSQ
jgi:hypothetical protein